MSSIGKAILKGAFYTGISNYSSILINLIVTSILARLLPPTDFGIITITTVITSFFDILANAGMGPAIIQKKTFRQEDLINVFRFSFIIAILLTTLYIFSVGPISQIYEEQQLKLVLSMVSIQLFFNALNVVPYTILLKKKLFKLIAKISVIVTSICGCAAIIWALFGGGIFSLLVIPIGKAIILFFTCYRITRIQVFSNKVKLNFDPVKEIFNYSSFQFCFNLVNFFSRNLDKLLLGKFLGMASLGYYEKSYRLMTLPISTLTNVFTPTIQPILSDFQNENSIIRNVYNKGSKYLFLAGCIIAPFLFFSADEIILIIFGPQWKPAVPIFQALLFSIPFQLVDSISGSIFQSANDFKHLFLSGVLCALINTGSLIFALIICDNINYIAIIVSASFISNFFISTYYINKYSIKQSFLAYLNKFVKCVGIVIVSSLVYWLINNINFSIWILFILKILIVIFISFMYFLFYKKIHV